MTTGFGSRRPVTKVFLPVRQVDIVPLFGRKLGVFAPEVVTSPISKQSAGGPNVCECADSS